MCLHHSPRRRWRGGALDVFWLGMVAVVAAALARGVQSSSSSMDSDHASANTFHFRRRMMNTHRQYRQQQQDQYDFVQGMQRVEEDEQQQRLSNEPVRVKISNKNSIPQEEDPPPKTDTIRLQERLLAAASKHKQRQPRRRKLSYSNSGGDDFYSTDDTTTNDDDSATSSSSFTTTTDNSTWSFLTSYALKYAGCRNVKSWRTTDNDEYDYENDEYSDNGSRNSALAQRTFVLLRLCPVSSCSAYNPHGCQASTNFGDYLLPASTYLSIMREYHVEQLKKYCTVCDACLSFAAPTAAPTAESTSTNAYSSAAAADDGYFADDYVASSYSSSSSSSSSSQSSNNYPWYIDDSTGQCMYQTACQNYQYPCKSYFNEQQQSTTTSSSSSSTGDDDDDSLFQCTAYSYDANVYYYAAPHCASDERTLQLGLFADRACGTLVRTSLFGSSSSSMFAPYVEKTCISCNAQESMALISDSTWQQTSSSSGGTSNVLLQANPLCAKLFNESAQCNQHLSSLVGSTTNSSVDKGSADACTYIAALQETDYDENGEVSISMNYEFAHWQRGTDLLRLVTHSQARPLQWLTLVLSVATTVCLAAYAVYLHKKLWYRKPWVPPADFVHSTFHPNHHRNDDDNKDDSRNFGGKSPIQNPSVEAGRISRRHSGIVAMRSRSADSWTDGVYQPYGAPIPTTRQNETNTNFIVTKQQQGRDRRDDDQQEDDFSPTGIRNGRLI